MTRYTFALLVCRSIGIISLIAILSDIGQYSGLIHLLVSSNASTQSSGSLAGLSYVAALIGVGLPLAGAVVGVASRRVAKRITFSKDVLPHLTPLAIATVTSWFMIDGLCNALVRTGLNRWNFARSMGAGAAETGAFAKMMGIYPGDIAWMSEQLGVALLAICVIVYMSGRNRSIVAGR